MDKNIEDLLRKAFAEMIGNHYGLAIPLLKEVLETEPTHELAWAALYDSYLHKDNKISAYHVLEKVYSQAPRDLKVLLQLGEYFQQEEINLQKADYYFDLILEYYPNNAEAYCLVGGSIYTRDIDRAMQLLHRAIEIDDTYIKSYCPLVCAYETKGNLHQAFALAMQGCLKAKAGESRGLVNSLGRLLERVAKKLVNGPSSSIDKEKLYYAIGTIETHIKTSIRPAYQIEYKDLLSKMAAYTILFQTKKYQPVILLELEDIQRTFFSLADEKERKQEQLLIYNLSLAYLLKHLYGVNILYLYQIQEDIKNKVTSIWQSYKQLYALAEDAGNQVSKGLEPIVNH